MKRKPAKPEPPATLPTLGMGEFMTRSKANEGHRIPLYAPDGRLTAEWIQVRGIDSDAFRRAQARQTRRIAEIAALAESAREDAIIDATLEMQASLVADWSFDMPCNHETAKAFLAEAPQIGAEIDKLATRRTFFFKMPSGSLMPTQPQLSS